jgi:hypothetical protein
MHHLICPVIPIILEEKDAAHLRTLGICAYVSSLLIIGYSSQIHNLIAKVDEVAIARWKSLRSMIYQHYVPPVF